MTRLAALLLAAVSLPAAAQKTRLEIRSEPLPAAAVAASVGLNLTGAWRLSAAHRGFGGFSGLAYFDGQLLMLSDGGWLVQLDPDNRADATISPLPKACRHGAGRHDADGEAIALTSDGMELRVALERETRLCGFSPRGGTEARSFALGEMLPGRGNSGVEAMATLPHQGTLLIAEARDKHAHHLLWFGRDARDAPSALMRYHAPAGFKPADAAFLPDGRLLVVNRRTGIDGKRSTSLTVGAFAPGPAGQVGGVEIAHIADSALAANFEGIAVVPRPGGATLWLISDDNFSSAAGTVLLRLDLDDMVFASAGSAPAPVNAGQ